MYISFCRSQYAGPFLVIPRFEPTPVHDLCVECLTPLSLCHPQKTLIHFNKCLAQVRPLPFVWESALMRPTSVMIKPLAKNCNIESAQSQALTCICLTFRSWSDVFSCVHHRMHVPRWFTIATVLLSIFFMIWLCFVIPASAPKQKVVSEDVSSVQIF